MLRIVHNKSKITIFKTLMVFFLLVIGIIYLADIKVIISRFANIKLTQEEISLKTALTWSTNNNHLSIKVDTRNQTVKTSTSGFPQKQQHGDLDEHRDSFKNISTTKTSLKITKTNNSSITVTPEVFPTTTTMTFNKSLVVHGKESPYIELHPENRKPITDRIFKITSVRQPTWIAKYRLNISTCKINQCVFDEGKVTKDTDIVVIYGEYMKDDFRVGQRWPHQLYVIQGGEPPYKTFSDYIHNGSSYWNNQINMIMSYRLDSEMFLPYYLLQFMPKPLDQRPNYYEIAKKKTKTAVWAVSNCKSFSQREEYVKEMQKYIDIDIIGACGISCSKPNTACNNWTTNYKFYLAFENSLCTDYVTEKILKIFKQNIYMIPVVRGGADYDKLFPNFTYINSAHFKTPKDLALHLKHLASDLETYSKYLEYKDLYILKECEVGSMVACTICTYLHTHKLPQPNQVYNLTQHLVEGQCHNATDV